MGWGGACRRVPVSDPEKRGRLGLWVGSGQPVEAGRGLQRFKSGIHARRMEKQKREDPGNAKPPHLRNALCF